MDIVPRPSGINRSAPRRVIRNIVGGFRPRFDRRHGLRDGIVAAEQTLAAVRALATPEQVRKIYGEYGDRAKQNYHFTYVISDERTQMAGRSQVPPAQALLGMSMDELIVSFNDAIGGGQGSVVGTASFWSQQIMHKQQLDAIRNMERLTEALLRYTRVITVATMVNILIAAFVAASAFFT